MLLKIFKKHVKPSSEKLQAMLDADQAGYWEVVGPEPEQLNDIPVVKVKSDEVPF